VLTENWIDIFVYCLNCGQVHIENYLNNKPVADFYCENCKKEYELKSKKNSIGTKIVDGAYDTI
jgi:type II restriction enzyme